MRIFLNRIVGLVSMIACVVVASHPAAAQQPRIRTLTYEPQQKEWIEHDSDLDALRNHPRFQALLKRL